MFFIHLIFFQITHWSLMDGVQYSWMSCFIFYLIIHRYGVMGFYSYWYLIKHCYLTILYQMQFCQMGLVILRKLPTLLYFDKFPWLIDHYKHLESEGSARHNCSTLSNVISAFVLAIGVIEWLRRVFWNIARFLRSLRWVNIADWLTNRILSWSRPTI